MGARQQVREPYTFSEALNKRLIAYAVAAAAAGAGLMATATPARATIDYTPADITISPSNGSITWIDVGGANQGIFGFTDWQDVGCLFSGTGCRNFFRLGAVEVFGENPRQNFNSFVSNVLATNVYRVFPAALPAKALIGPVISVDGGVGGEPAVPGGALRFFSSAPFTSIVRYGNWGSNKTAYLGLEFLKKGGGAAYFGWAKVAISGTVPYPPFTGSGVKVTIEGYAYETDPGVAIEAGQTSDAPEPGTLALLALGAVGLLAVRRRRRPAAKKTPS